MSAPVVLDAALLAPYDAFFEAERPQMERVAQSAAELAREAFAAASASASSASASPLPRARVPEDCSGPTSNFMACAFSWSVSYTNELRRLEREAGAPVSKSSPLLASARLRMARPCDVGHIMGFIRELAEFEREPEAVITDERVMLRDGFTAGRGFHCVLCEVPRDVWASVVQPSVPSLPAPSPDWVPIAFGHVHATYSTWEGRSMYIEDLYVQPPFRRQGLSGLFFACIARAADICGSARLQWSALNWNTPAISAYCGPAIKANHLSEWNIYRLYRDGIRRLSTLPVDEMESRKKKEGAGGV